MHLRKLARKSQSVGLLAPLCTYHPQAVLNIQRIHLQYQQRPYLRSIRHFWGGSQTTAHLWCQVVICVGRFTCSSLHISSASCPKHSQNSSEISAKTIPKEYTSLLGRIANYCAPLVPSSHLCCQSRHLHQNAVCPQIEKLPGRSR